MQVHATRDGMRNPNPLKTYVIHVEPVREYTNSNNKKMAIIEGIVADNSGHTKISVYNKLAFPFLKKGNSLMLINVIVKREEIVATGESKIIMIPKLQLEEDIVNAAEQSIINLTLPKPTGLLKIHEVLELNEGTVFNIIGKITEVW